MAVSADYMAYIADLLAPLARRAGELRVRRMFGGAGVYHGRTMFGLIADETLYFKADESCKARHEAHGCGPFIFRPAGKKPIAMSYWQVPEEVMEDRDALLEWAQAALRAAQKNRAPKKPRRAAKSEQAEREQMLKEHAPWLI